MIKAIRMVTGTVMVLGFMSLVSAGLTAEAEVTYLSRPWFHKADNLNLLTSPGGQRLAVDNQGRFIADASVAAHNRNIN